MWFMDKIPHQKLTYKCETKNIHRNRHGKKIPFALYTCECGNIAEKNKADVNRGRVRSCGKCVGHRMTGTRFYRIWKAVKTRTSNPNYAEYHLYGGRGIGLCDRWQSFNNFKEDMFDSYIRHVNAKTERQTTIERVDVNKGYNPENCVWATYSEQNYNRRKYVFKSKETK